ncbi:hypothetical protein DESUT3_10010 [Desulfuromonas versatilis]|uniref:NHL repeat containing protein n=1 Tax=Desulfuromonas versatilis TaxID=2802975 RepID=A0ABM8HTH4_9BACT|nr:hypothetical protein [Desulfuromonas versatilis]BCR03932.1 hypothetical protein DESUT3_10010 [Desulfuromonas versatilis]
MRNLTSLIVGGMAGLLLLSGCSAGSAAKPRILWPLPPNEPRLEWVNTYASQDDFPKTQAQKLSEQVVGKPEAYTFKTPFGVVADGKGTVYVSDVHHKNIRVYDFNNYEIHFLTDQPVFSLPLGLAIDQAGRLYIADGEARNVKVYSPQQVPLFAIGDEKIFENPAFLAINERLNRIYVSDGKAHKIQVFDLQGKHLFAFGEQGREPGKLFGPQGMAIDGQDRVFVADMLNARIQVFDAQGKYLYHFGERGDRDWQFENPKDLAFDSEGNLHIVDTRKALLLTYAPEGRLLLATGGAGGSNHPLGFASPHSIFIDGNDRLYIADGLNKRFAVWQYLSKKYLAQNPITPEDIERLDQFLKKEKGK